MKINCQIVYEEIENQFVYEEIEQLQLPTSIVNYNDEMMNISYLFRGKNQIDQIIFTIAKLASDGEKYAKKEGFELMKRITNAQGMKRLNNDHFMKRLIIMRFYHALSIQIRSK